MLLTCQLAIPLGHLVLPGDSSARPPCAPGCRTSSATSCSRMTHQLGPLVLPGASLDRPPRALGCLTSSATSCSATSCSRITHQLGHLVLPGASPARTSHAPGHLLPLGHLVLPNTSSSRPPHAFGLISPFKSHTTNLRNTFTWPKSGLCSEKPTRKILIILVKTMRSGIRATSYRDYREHMMTPNTQVIRIHSGISGEQGDLRTRDMAPGMEASQSPRVGPEAEIPVPGQMSPEASGTNFPPSRAGCTSKVLSPKTSSFIPAKRECPGHLWLSTPRPKIGYGIMPKVLRRSEYDIP